MPARPRRKFWFSQKEWIFFAALPDVKTAARTCAGGSLCFGARQSPPRIEQDCTKERNQDQTCVCFRNHWDLPVLASTSVIVTPMVLVPVALEPVSVIMMGNS